MTQRSAIYGELWNGSPAGVILTIDDGVERRLDEPVESLTYRVTDAHGREYPLRRVGPLDQRNWWVPLGYAQTPLDPRLEASFRGATKAVPLSAFPVPAPTNPPLTSDAPFRLVETATGVRAVPANPEPKGDSWTINVLATRFAPDLRCPDQSIGSVYPGSYKSYTNSADVPLPYPHDAGWVRLRFDVGREVTQIADVAIKGLRLSMINGETGFLIEKPRAIPNPFGWKMTIPIQRGQTRLSQIDHRNPRLDLKIDHRFYSSGFGERTGKPEDGTLSMELIRPQPEELGVNTLLIGSHLQASKRSRGPVSKASFDAVVRMRYRREAPVSHRIYVVPVQRS